MKTKLYSFVTLCASLLMLQYSNAQCNGNYIDMVYSNVTKHADVVYTTSNSTNLKMDIYEPTGDVSAKRPLIIMAHGGSFIGGDKGQDNVCTTICTNYAKRGYVTADIQYRLGNALGMLDSATAIDVVMKAISDGKSAIRFFKLDAAGANTYRIDTNFIIAGGNSAGAVLYIHALYIDSVNEAPSALRTIINNNGGIEGNSGNAGPTSLFHAVLNLAGGLNVPEFVGPGNKPSFNAQGDQDATVPYNCANAQSGLTPVRLCGLGVIEPLYNTYGILHQSIVYPGAGHVPWQSNAAEMTQIDTSSAIFFSNLYCGTASAISNVKNETSISMFPNPASSELNIRSSEKVANVMLFNNLGQLVLQNNLGTANGKINTVGLAKGVYPVRIEFADKNISSVTKMAVIE